MPRLMSLEVRFFSAMEGNVRKELCKFTFHNRLKASDASTSKRTHRFIMDHPCGVAGLKIWFALWENCTDVLSNLMEKSNIAYSQGHKDHRVFIIMARNSYKGNDVLAPTDCIFDTIQLNQRVKKYFSDQDTLEQWGLRHPLPVTKWFRSILAVEQYEEWRRTKGFSGTMSGERFLATLGRTMDTSRHELLNSYFYVKVNLQFLDDDSDVDEDYLDCPTPPVEAPMRFRPRFNKTPAIGAALADPMAIGKKRMSVKEHLGYKNPSLRESLMKSLQRNAVVIESASGSEYSPGESGSEHGASASGSKSGYESSTGY